MTRGGASIYLCRGAQGTQGTWIWMGFDRGMFQLYEGLVKAGVKIVLRPTNFSWAFELQIEDPDGHVIRLGTDPDPSQAYRDLAS